MKGNRGFTLIELVITIVLIGIMAVGLYNIVILGINNYYMNENYLHQTNSMSLAISIMRRNISNAAMPIKPLIKPRGRHYCKLKNGINPAVVGEPIVIANMAGQTTFCGGINPPCNEVAFYKYITGTASQELVVFCVNPKNNVLYKQVTIATTTTDYPSLNNIDSIAFSSTDVTVPPFSKYPEGRGDPGGKAEVNSIFI